MALVSVLLAFSFIAFWFIGLIHCLKYQHSKDRLVWVLVTLFGGPIGAFIYFAMGRPAKHLGPPVVIGSDKASPPAIEPLPAQYFDPGVMNDDKLRAQLIADAVWKDAKTNRASGR